MKLIGFSGGDICGVRAILERLGFQRIAFDTFAFDGGPEEGCYLIDIATAGEAEAILRVGGVVWREQAPDCEDVRGVVRKRQAADEALGDYNGLLYDCVLVPGVEVGDNTLIVAKALRIVGPSCAEHRTWATWIARWGPGGDFDAPGGVVVALHAYRAPASS